MSMKREVEDEAYSPMDVKHGGIDERAESFISQSKKIEDELWEQGEKVKHYEENVKYLKYLTKKLEESIHQLQAKIGKHQRASLSKRKDGDPGDVGSEEKIIQHIMKYENSAAALLIKMKSNPGAQSFDNSLAKDVLGVVATLGKADDANLSRLFAEYLGLETMLGVVCKTYKGVKALEAYTSDGLIDTGCGIYGLAASIGRKLNNRFTVICLENLRPYPGDLINDDPQRRLDLLQPRLVSGEKPPGFLGYAVNMITIEGFNLHSTGRAGYTLRETLFYYLFSDLQVYRSREDMLKALPCIRNAAVSLDGGMLRHPGVFTLGHLSEDIGVRFPCDPGPFNPPIDYYELQNQLKQTEWKKNRTLEDLNKEQELLDHAKFNFEAKKRDFVQMLAANSSFATQYQVERGSASASR